VPVSRDDKPQRSLGTLLGDLADGSAELVRDEIRLARAEALESVLGLRIAAIWISIALVVAICAAGAFVAFAIDVLAEYLLGGRIWAAALIVAAILGAAASLCIRQALRSSSKGPVKAEGEVATSTRESVEWLKPPTKSAIK
jgi:hypothetical protein